MLPSVEQPPGGDRRFAVDGAVLDLPGRMAQYVFCGTERGLGIPAPIHSLSCRYDAESETATLNWALGADSHDEVVVLLPGATYRLPDARTTHVCRGCSVAAARDALIWVVAFCGTVPSNAAGIRMGEEQGKRIQHELFSIPFSCGVAPNWVPWTGAGSEALVMHRQGTKRDRQRFVSYPADIKSPDDKPYYQLIKTSSPDAVGGVWRQFLGLTPNRYYRLSARLNTLSSDRDSTPSSFSLHVAHDAAGGDASLSTQQLAGVAPLPDGSHGSDAAMVGVFGPKRTTKGNWVEASTGFPRDKPLLADIRIPEGVDSITVWLRCTGNLPEGVGMDYIRLEDVTSYYDAPAAE